MARIHPQIDKQQVRARRGLDTQLARQVEIVRGGEHMDRIGEQQNIVSGRQRITDEVSLDPTSIRNPLGLACEPTTRHFASTRQLEQCAAQRRVPSQDGEQERAGAASNCSQRCAMPSDGCGS
jgi:hypothetical protein